MIRSLAGALAIACILALCASPAEATRHHHARHLSGQTSVQSSGPMTCDTDGRCKGGGSLPEFSSLLPVISPHYLRQRTSGNLCTGQGHCATVAAWAVDKFRGLVSDLEAMGYAIGSPGCLSGGHMRNSKHHWGGACDLFNQVARNRTALRQPPPTVQIEVARRHGLISGCEWRRSPDCGHFEVSRR